MRNNLHLAGYFFQKTIYFYKTSYFYETAYLFL